MLPVPGLEERDGDVHLVGRRLAAAGAIELSGEFVMAAADAEQADEAKQEGAAFALEGSSYSLRKASIGSTRAARRAGISVAAKATEERNAAAAR